MTAISDQPLPLVGVSSYGLNDFGRYDLPAQYIGAVRRAGGMPVLVPPGESNWRQMIERLDALVLTGGGDIAPSQYGGGEHEMIYNIDKQRDSFELALGAYVSEFPLPTLAICRGMQIINVANGGSLYLHLPDEYGDVVPHRVPPRNPVTHSVSLEQDSMLAQYIGSTQFDCQSWHHQSVDQMAEGFVPVGFAPDGCIEAMESAEKPWLKLVQWHPELSAATDPLQQGLFDHLIEQAVNARS